MNSILEISEQVNIQTGLNPSTGSGRSILIIRTFDRKGDWQLEVVFDGGAKVTGPVTAEEVSIIESDLSDKGWVILPSLFSNGFSAKPWPVDDCGMMFASSAGMWPDDYAIEPVAL